MKIAKKFMALALAAVLSVGCAFCVSADGSRTKDVTVSQAQSQIYEIIQKIEDTDGFKELKELRIFSRSIRQLQKHSRKLEKAKWICLNSSMF